MIENKDDYVHIVKTVSILSGRILEQDKLIKKQNEDFRKLKEELELEKMKARVSVMVRESISDNEMIAADKIYDDEHFKKMSGDHSIRMIDKDYHRLDVGDYVFCSFDKNTIAQSMKIIAIIEKDTEFFARVENSIMGAECHFFEMQSVKHNPLIVSAHQTTKSTLAASDTSQQEQDKYLIDKNNQKIFVGDTVRVFDLLNKNTDLVVKDFSKMFGKDYVEFGNGYAVVVDRVSKIEKHKEFAYRDNGYISLLNPNESWMTDENGDKITMSDLVWVRRNGALAHVHKIKSIDYNPSDGFTMTDQTDTIHRSRDFKKWIAK